MNFSYWLPLMIPLTSLAASIPIFFLKEESRTLRSFLNISSALLKIILVIVLIRGVFSGETYEFRYSLFLNFDILLNADRLSLLFVGLSAFLWLLTTIYAIGYLEGTPDRSRFFGFFGLCVAATTAIALAGNLFSLLVFYELLTLTTYPLVVHWGTRESLEAGRSYLVYTMGGGAALLFAMVWLSSLVGASDFSERGILSGLDVAYLPQLSIIFLLLILGFGVKAALIPLHGWLPKAMVAPAPVSALLHSVAVVKAGAFGIIRVVNDIYGVEFCRRFRLTEILILLSSATIIYGSLRAIFQDDLKRRLAYSTVSQISYIVLGISLLVPNAAIGGMVHLVYQGIMKITLFLCAGNFAHGVKVTRISQMDGIGSVMPLTMGAFTLAAFGMIGVPPTAGFITKWYLATGGVESDRMWVLAILLISSAINAAYFLPIIYVAWFKKPKSPMLKLSRDWSSIRKNLLFPPILTAALTVILGLFAGLALSPLSWVKFIVFLEYGL